jgi:hypothetical protein
MFGKDVVQKILEKYFEVPLSGKIDKLVFVIIQLQYQALPLSSWC